jgi:tRNA (cytidine32/uridine32-2'-O)-methyltransferase
MLNKVKITLVKPIHPGNIGAVARAMKTMGLTKLALVAPQYFPSPTANAMASRATDILENAEVHKTLVEALATSQVIFGTSARSRIFEWPQLTLREAALSIAAEVEKGNQISLLFGTESTGLSNDELKHCHYHVYIPANPEFSSLNLAQAVQVASYELMMAFNTLQTPRTDTRILAPYENLERFYQHLQKIAYDVEFLKGPHGEVMMLKLRRLFQRAQMDDTEITTLRGILSNIERMLIKK